MLETRGDEIGSRLAGTSSFQRIKDDEAYSSSIGGRKGRKDAASSPSWLRESLEVGGWFRFTYSHPHLSEILLSGGDDDDGQRKGRCRLVKGSRGTRLRWSARGPSRAETKEKNSKQKVEYREQN